MKTKQYEKGFRITSAATCDFDLMESIDNKQLIERYPKLTKHRTDLILQKVLGINHRYFVKEEKNAGDLAKSALFKLLEKDPSLKTKCDFVIYVGISNPYPTVCMASFLAHAAGISNTSCWDIKSGCSSGILALIQALDRIRSGSQSGIIILAESLSKFINADEALNYMAIGDGAIAVAIEASDEWKISGVIHGTDPVFMQHLYVPDSYPKASDKKPTFQIQSTEELATSLDYYWIHSLEELLTLCEWKGSEVTHYIAHQINESKNKFFGQMATIPEKNIFMNLRDMGNIGSPAIFFNYFENILNADVQFTPGDKLIFHAVGGGISWAGIGLERV